MNRKMLTEELKIHEGLRLKVYKDSRGKLTIGYGRNLENNGITEDEAEWLLDNDITRVMKDCQARIKVFGSLDSNRQNILCEMAFNLGVDGLLGFHKMLDYIERRDFDGASREMLDSVWANQVGDRAKVLAKAMKEG